jgi:hypothetical protein
MLKKEKKVMACALDDQLALEKLDAVLFIRVLLQTILAMPNFSPPL